MMRNASSPGRVVNDVVVIPAPQPSGAAPVIAATVATLLVLVVGSMSCTKGGQQPPKAEKPSESVVASAPATETARLDPPAATAHPTGPARSCALKLSGNPHRNMSVAIVVQNRTTEPMAFPYHHPLLFALEAWAGSKQLTVQMPPYDGPVEPRTATVAPGQRLTIATPVTLRFAPDGEPQTDSPFEWLVLSPPTDVRLVAKRVFTDTPELACELEAHFR